MKPVFYGTPSSEPSHGERYKSNTSRPTGTDASDKGPQPNAKEDADPSTNDNHARGIEHDWDDYDELKPTGSRDNGIRDFIGSSTALAERSWAGNGGQGMTYVPPGAWGRTHEVQTYELPPDWKTTVSNLCLRTNFEPAELADLFQTFRQIAGETDVYDVWSL